MGSEEVLKTVLKRSRQQVVEKGIKVGVIFCVNRPKSQVPKFE
jgi:hypothetical protein